MKCTAQVNVLVLSSVILLYTPPPCLIICNGFLMVKKVKVHRSAFAALSRPSTSSQENLV